MAGSGGIDLYARIFGQSSPSSTAAEPLFLNDTPEKDDLAQKVMRDISGAEGTFQAWWGPAQKEIDYYHGNQWNPQDRMKMETLKKPALVFNEIMPVIDAVSGLERLNRSDPIFRSRALEANPQEDAAGDLATEAVAAADDLCDAGEEFSEVAKKMAMGGMAWAEIKMDYSHDINGRVIFEQIPEKEMRWDSNGGASRNLVKTSWRARIREVSRKEFEKNWPGKLDLVDMSVPEMPYGQTEKYELVTPYYSRANQSANPQVGNQTQLKKTVPVIQYQWRDMQPVYRFQDEDSGEITVLDEEKWNRLKDRKKMLGAIPPPAVRQMKPAYRQVEVSRGVVLDEPVDLPGGWSLLCLTGKWDDGAKRFYGLIKPMMDPQDTKNKAISSALGFHIVNAKGGTIFKTRLFADPVDAKEQWAKPDAWIEANDDSDLRTDLLPREPQQMPSELGMFYQEASRSITKTSGVNEELVGLAQGQTPSQTSGRRAQAALVILGWFWDNLNRLKRERARMMLEFIREYWTQGQFIQVGGEFANEGMPLLKESLPLDYSLVLDDSVRHNPDMKAQVWEDLMQKGIIQVLMKSGAGQILLELFKYSPWPYQVKRDIIKAATQNPPQQPQKGRGKSDPPELIGAKVNQMNANAQKAIAQARMIEQQSGLKLADLVAKTTLDAQRVKAERERTHMKGFAQQFGQPFGAGQ